MLWEVASLHFLGFLRSGEITIPADSAYNSSTHDSLTDVADVDNSHYAKISPESLKDRPV